MTGAILLRTKYMPDPSLLQRLRDAVSIFRCKCSPVFLEESSAPDKMQVAGSIDIRMPHDRPSFGWQSPDGLEHCAGCPRFKAYRQGVATGKYRDRNLEVAAAIDGVKADVSNGDGEGAQVYHMNANTPFAATIREHETEFDPHTNTVVYPVAPGIVDTQHGAQNGNCQSDGSGLHCYSPKVEAEIVTQGGAV